MSSSNAQLSISGSAYRHSTVGNWPFSRSDKAANKPEAEDCPYENTKKKMLGIYSFGHLKEIQASQRPTDHNSEQPVYGYPSKKDATPKNMTTFTVQNRDIQLLWDGNAPNYEEPDTPAGSRPASAHSASRPPTFSSRPPSARPASAHPAHRKKEPELEYLAPVPRHQRPTSARQPRSYYHHQGLRAPSLVAIANATQKEFLHNKIQGRKGSIVFGTDDD
mmetsp:Transcript_26657/g.44678  ORF Transcript_26657/g.44678 Transcript_26657/m.44678 type:complete len:220 (+) Transcript_26657:183-842(+)|eukprot:CAMPEP_0198223268 /NCGR_PEP_ID=MMETSP1445-20131203/91799_1 /TAXON_ID=36898 /ORGANISM="Pyramimonas sp., Strain CCMP2087" /LENGTH=219 /DNA_ID=CAMNT_0043902055 /DNA_START=177 /DNA_END=836 /DNA_ORIENTATION=-